MVRAAGARPEPLRAVMFLDLASKKSAKQSPPRPVDAGSVTLRAAAVAMAASAALPPFIRMERPAWLANGWLEATMPRRAKMGDR
jgi:hypothetical protein